MKIKTINITLLFILIFIILSQLYNLRENAENQSSCDNLKNEVQDQKVQINDLQQQIQTQNQEIQTQNQEIQTQKYKTESQIHKNNSQTQADFCNYARDKFDILESKVRATIDGLKKVK